MYRIAKRTAMLILMFLLTASVSFAEESIPQEEPEQPVAEEPAAQEPATEEPAAQEPAKETKPEAFVMGKVKAKRSGAGTKLSWKRIQGVKEYRIFRAYSKNGKKTRIAVVRKNTYKDVRAKSGKGCYYFVRACKEVKGKLVKSKAARVKAKPIYRVYIETGHGRRENGQWDPGACWKGYQEAKLMIPIVKQMTRFLEKQGVYVYTDAFKGNCYNLDKTRKIIKTKQISAFVNIHCDAWNQPSGTLPLYKTKEQKKLAKALNKGVHKYVKIKDRGLCRRTDLETLNKVKVTSCLFETGSIRGDNKVLRKKTKAYGKGLARGLCTWMGIPFRG